MSLLWKSADLRVTRAETDVKEAEINQKCSQTLELERLEKFL